MGCTYASRLLAHLPSLNGVKSKTKCEPDVDGEILLIANVCFQEFYKHILQAHSTYMGQKTSPYNRLYNWYVIPFI